MVRNWQPEKAEAMAISHSTMWDARLADDFLAMLGVQADRRLIPHGAAGQKEPGLTAEDLRGARFQAIDGGILAVDVVANLGRSHGGAHRGRWLGDGVAAQIDHGNRHRCGRAIFGENSRLRGHKLLFCNNARPAPA